MVQSDKALQIQIRQLETLLKKAENNTCADCPGKTPRWASITFGTFVCLRCSGQHRALGVHITKIKSVNLDKWPNGKVEAFQAMSNNLVNAYWEANLPKNFQKPAQNASTSEVTRFLNQKYVEKRFVDTDMKYDPLYLWENKRSRFDKFVKRCMARAGIGSESDEESEEEPAPRQKLGKPGRVQKAPSQRNVAAAAAVKQPQAAPPQQPAPDLISMAPAAQQDNQFGDFVSASPAQNQDDGFGDFVGTPRQAAAVQQPPQQPNQQQNMINNIMQMMQQNPQANPSNTKYAAFEVMGDWNQQQQQRQAQMQQMQMLQQQQQQQQQQQPNNPFGGQPQQPAQASGGFQPQFFNSALQQQQQAYQSTGQFGGMPQQQMQNNMGGGSQWQATFNTGGGQQQNNNNPQQMQNNLFAGATQQQQQQPQNNIFAGMQTQPTFNTGNGGGGAQMGGGGFGGFQSATPQQQPAMGGGGSSTNSGSYYGGLVDLSAKGNNNTQAPGFGGAPQQSTQAQQNASFGNLVNW